MDCNNVFELILFIESTSSINWKQEFINELFFAVQLVKLMSQSHN